MRHQWYVEAEVIPVALSETVVFPADFDIFSE
jgi:hypothetical protein